MYNICNTEDTLSRLYKIDRIVVLARGHRAAAFYILFDWPKFRSYAKLKYGGPDNARALAHELCLRSRYYFEVWESADFLDDFVFTEVPVVAESAEFLELGSRPTALERCLRGSAAGP